MKEDFTYSYKALNKKEKDEVIEIRNKYVIDDDVDKLKKLNRKVEAIPQVIGISTGVIGTLVLGTGMSLVLELNVFVWGIILGVIGLLMVAAAFPLYNHFYTKNKNRYKDEIIALANKILSKE